MAYEIISQNNTTTTLSDGTNTITVPARVTLATSTSYTISEVNNNTATLEGSDGSVIRDVPCVVVLAGEGGGGGGDQHNLGYYATQAALEEAHPTAEAGDWAIVGSTDTVWLWDTDNEEWVDTDTKGQVESVNAKTGEVVLTAIDVKAVPEYSIMPTAGAEHANKIVQYTGGTNASYTKGYFYQGKVSATPSTASISQTTGTSLANLTVDKSTFETAVSHTTGNYAFTSDGTNWSYDGNTVDLTDYGITYTGTPVADDVITVVYYAPVYLYYWEQINVQPQGSSLPSQTGNSGKFLTTDGTDASWSNYVIVSSASENGISISSTNTNTSNRRTTIGNGTAAAGKYGVAIGYNAQTGESSVAIGNTAKALGTMSFAAGEGATATYYGIAIGSQNKTTANYAIQIGGTYKTNSDANTFKVGNNNGNFEIMSADGTIPADRLPNAINKYSTMPTAASTNVGWIVQFTGATDSTYTHGYIYECKAQGTSPETYAWEAVTVQAGGGGGGLPSQTGNSGKFLTTDGTDASWSDKPLVNTATGQNTFNLGLSSGDSVNNGTAVGINSYLAGPTATAIGSSAKANTDSVAVGAGSGDNYATGAISIGTTAWAKSTGAISIGCQTRATANYAIQLGTSNIYIGVTNSDANTFKVANQNGNFEIMSADGTIPTARLTKANTTVTLAVADWSSSTQTVSVTGVTATSIVLVAPDSASQSDYTSAGILCTAQGAGTLTFTATTTPTNAITVNVVAL